jgi:hypothetical protein
MHTVADSTMRHGAAGLVSSARAALRTRAASDATLSIVASKANNALSASDARAVRDASDARVVGNAMSALHVLAARAVRDASDAISSRDPARTRDSAARFARWAVQHGSWLLWWDLSHLAATYFGAAQMDSPAVIAWTRPLLDAFIGGCWLMFWTSETVYWVAKPVVRVESARDGARLHCDSGPALASDVEHLYFVHGVMVPEAVVMRPETLTAQDVRQEENEEVRRIMIERMGWPRYLRETGAVVLHRRTNAIDATKEALMQSEDGSHVLVCSCPSTGRVYGMRVPRNVATCEQAQSWLSGDAAGRTIGAS